MNQSHPINQGNQGNPDRRGMYDLAFPSPEVRPDDRGVSMLVALQGYADAGQAVSHAARHLLDALDHRLIASFNNDELIDYRSRRPAIGLTDGDIADIEDLSLSLHVVKDTSGRPFLLLSGPEPDLRWDAFSAAVADLADRFNIAEAVGLYAAPMTVPHTRPTVVTAHGTDRETLSGFHTWPAQIQVPGSASLRVEQSVAARGRQAFGFTAHVPHYIAASDYPRAVVELLTSFSQLAGLSLPLGSLEKDAERVDQQLAEQVEENHEIAAVVHMLERQFDDEAARMQELRRNPLVDDGHLPTGDELGAELERFLAEHGGDAAPEAGDGSRA